MEFLGVLGEKLPHTYSPIINRSEERRVGKEC